jgi:hypothetical protein
VAAAVLREELLVSVELARLMEQILEAELMLVPILAQEVEALGVLVQEVMVVAVLSLSVP